MKLPSSLSRVVFMMFATVSLVHAQGYDQDYQDYGDQDDYYGHQDQDNMYHDYAQNQQAKAQGGGGGGGGGMVQSVAIGVAGWFLGGKIHSKRAVTKANKKSKTDLKELYTRYVQDVTTLQQQNAELEKFIKQSAKQQLTEEFLSADLDNNRQVSRAEFEMHKKQYLQKHPEYAGQFPSFDEFDPDGNGMITIGEHERYYEERGMI